MTKIILAVLVVGIRLAVADVVLVDETNKRYVVLWRTAEGGNQGKICLAIPDLPARDCQGEDIKNLDGFWDVFKQYLPMQNAASLEAMVKESTRIEYSLNSPRVINRTELEKQKTEIDAKLEIEIERKRLTSALLDTEYLEIKESDRHFKMFNEAWQAHVPSLRSNSEVSAKAMVSEDAKAVEINGHFVRYVGPGTWEVAASLDEKRTSRKYFYDGRAAYEYALKQYWGIAEMEREQTPWQMLVAANGEKAPWHTTFTEKGAAIKFLENNPDVNLHMGKVVKTAAEILRTRQPEPLDKYNYFPSEVPHVAREQLFPLLLTELGRLSRQTPLPTFKTRQVFSIVPFYNKWACVPSLVLNPHASTYLPREYLAEVIHWTTTEADAILWASAQRPGIVAIHNPSGRLMWEYNVAENRTVDGKLRIHVKRVPFASRTEAEESWLKVYSNTNTFAYLMKE